MARRIYSFVTWFMWPELYFRVNEGRMNREDFMAEGAD